MTRGDLSDAEWELVEPYLPLGERGPIPDLRCYFNAVMWRFRTGSPWRDIPERYGSWSSVYGRFRLWAKAGTFQALMDMMIAEAAARGQVDMRDHLVLVCACLGVLFDWRTGCPVR